MKKYISNIIICVGIFLTIFGYHLHLKQQAFNNNAVKVSAFVYDIQKTYNNKNEQVVTTYISYDINGNNYRVKFNTNKSIYDTVDIYVNKNSPLQIRNCLYSKYILIVPAIGVAILIITILQILPKKRKQKKDISN